MPHINLSFAACGFLGVYHLGAASALCKHGRKLLKDVKAFAGASAGSLVASVLLTAPQKIEECNKFTYDFAEEIRRQSFGALTPGYDFMARLRSGVESILPANAHELAHDRLYVSITNTRTRRNCLVSRFPSREDLIQKWVDGGFTNSLPVLPAGRTVTISPFSGRLDVSPQDKGRLHFYVSITNQDVLRQKLATGLRRRRLMLHRKFCAASEGGSALELDNFNTLKPKPSVRASLGSFLMLHHQVVSLAAVQIPARHVANWMHEWS
ncbi:patatin-like phospholipase domain-containing protein 4 isoform X2 [Cervus canadensis]|uniref:patatin-like phospholipase domain-containing protein 4 isoform X2 n=1 Tax=Cervus canadensis TaxID=1574408 RepID=UPI001CA32CBB|nr:patatin-like phospholipase domain-containing protein 4 isoform X2 [Cervus canadensis]